MNPSSLRELGLDLMGERQYLRALGAFAESVRREPADHRSRMFAARCLTELGERERAVLVLHSCAEGLLRRDFLLSAMAACRQALQINQSERMVQKLLLQVHSRAVRTAQGRAMVPPPLPPQPIGDGTGVGDLMSLEGTELTDRAMEVLLNPDPSRLADAHARPPLPLFADLSPEAFLRLVMEMDYRQVPPKTVLTTAGEAPEALFVLVAGKAEVAVPADDGDRTLGFLGGGSMFGEVALLTGTVPAASVTAAVHCELFEIRKSVLEALVQREPSVAETLASFGQMRLARSVLQASPLFLALEEQERPQLLEAFEYRAFAEGERIVEEGQTSRGLVLVLAGELMVQKRDDDGGLVAVSSLRDGDIAGEISLLKGTPATATVAAARKTAVAFMPRAEFQSRLDRFPAMRELLERLSTQRLAQMREVLRPAEILDADELVVAEEVGARPPPEG